MLSLCSLVYYKGSRSVTATCKRGTEQGEGKGPRAPLSASMCPATQGLSKPPRSLGHGLEVPTLWSHGWCLHQPAPTMKLSGPPATSHLVNGQKQINSRIAGPLCQERNKDQIRILYFTRGSMCSLSMEGRTYYLLYSTVPLRHTHTCSHIHPTPVFTHTPHTHVHTQP